MLLERILRALIAILQNLGLGSSSSTLLIIIAVAIMIVALIIIIAPFVIIGLINFMISWQMATAVKMKGHNFFIGFFMCFMIGIPGYFYAIALPDVAKQHQLEKIINTLQTTKELAHDGSETPSQNV